MTDAPWVGLKANREEIGQLESWAWLCAQVQNGSMTEQEALKASWEKTKNNVNVTITRMRRYQRTAGQDDRRDDSPWVTIAAELGRNKDETSPLAIKAKDYNMKMLVEYGFLKKGANDPANELYLDWMVGSNGVITISIQTKHLRRFMQRREEKAAAKKS
jgi:hypothetical protein